MRIIMHAISDSIKAFERAAEGRPTDVKLQIRWGDSFTISIIYFD
jgi:hypothetical protein